jgi:hypothetical protein
MRVIKINKGEFDNFIYQLKNLTIPQRQEIFEQIFGKIKIDPQMNSYDIRICWLDFTLYYSEESVIQ